MIQEVIITVNLVLVIGDVILAGWLWLATCDRSPLSTARQIRQAVVFMLLLIWAFILMGLFTLVH